MTLPVYYFPGMRSDDVACGSFFEFAGSEARHAATVRRTRVGELIDLVDGHGFRVTIEVRALEKAKVQGVVREIVHDKPHTVQVLLVQALSKGGRDEQAIEIATEYGVDSVMPWQADRSVSRWEGSAKIVRGFEKWEATVLTAAKQSRRSWIPGVQPFVDSAGLTQWIKQECARGTYVYVCHEEAEILLTSEIQLLLNELKSSSTSLSEGASKKEKLNKNDWGEIDCPRIVFIVGPEGGISDREMREFEAAGAHTVLLGEHVMRASSAGSWAIAVTRAFLCENFGQASDRLGYKKDL